MRSTVRVPGYLPPVGAAPDERERAGSKCTQGGKDYGEGASRGPAIPSTMQRVG
jgi:hypothetical protein